MNEKEAIDIVDNKIWDLMNTVCGNCIIEDHERDDYQEAIETVLNLLEKKDKEIKKYKMLFAQSTAERVITSLKDSEKSKEDLEMLYKGCQMELEKKDKIIDLMTEYITYCFNEDEGICKKSASAINYQSYYCDNNCKKCIKQYFEKKVEEDKQC